ncbi:MAG: hypothetical protein WAX44_02880 [Minisyncoccia bacterium]
MFCGLVLGVILVFAGPIALSYPTQPGLGVGISASGFGVLILSFLAGMSFKNTRDLAFRSIKADVSRLAGALSLTVEGLCSWPVKDIKFAGKTTMVKLAGDILDFEVHVNTAKLEASAYLCNITRHFWDEHQMEMKAPLSGLHKALLAFGLTPETYNWAFSEAMRERRKNSPQ